MPGQLELSNLAMSTPQKITNAEQLLRIRTLLQHFEQGRIPRLAQHEVHPNVPLDSRENYLYFTLPVCINFQRSSPAMWASALATFNDATTNYVFFPEKLTEVPMEQIRADLLKHKLALQPNKHTHIWTTIASTLHRFYHDDPRQILVEANYDAGKLVKDLQATNHSRFPYLSGPKLSNYWPYILSQYTSAPFVNIHELSIIPDTHVIQSSEHLGLVNQGASQKQVELAWHELLDGSGIAPVQMHPVLWNWSRNHFKPDV